MNRGVLIMVPFAVAAGSYASYRVEQDKVERQAFEDAMFEQLVAEEKERERKERERREAAAAAPAPKRRGFWG